jgi:hypothetical protein
LRADFDSVHGIVKKWLRLPYPAAKTLCPKRLFRHIPEANAWFKR